MAEFLKTLLWLSAAGSILGLLIYTAKCVCGGRVSETFGYYLWLLVLLRLTVPVSSPFDLSLPQTPAANTVPTAAEMQTEQSETYAAADARTSGGVPEASVVQAAGTEKISAWDAAFRVWAAGAGVSASWFVLSYAKYYKRLMSSAADASAEERGALEKLAYGRRPALIKSRIAGTPLLLGVFRPIIILPEREYSTDELENILRHELIHLRRGDVIYKWALSLAASLHWFNPLMILLRRQVSLDCELACDEAVIRGMSENGRLAYGNTLISMSAARPLPAGVTATTMCEEKRQLKGRLMHIKNYSVRKGGAAVLAAVLAMALVGCAAVSGPAETVRSGEAIYDGTAYYSPGGFDTPLPAWLNTAGTSECGMAYISGSDYELWYRDGTVVPLTKEIFTPEQAADYSPLGVFISPEKTALAFGSTEGGPITVRVSGDEGKTWQSKEIPFKEGVESVLTGFSTTKDGWLLTRSQPAMGAEQHSLFITSDGGRTWKKVKSDLDEVYGRVVTGAGFIDADTGFVCFRYEDGNFAPAVCMTRDGGRTWQKLKIKAAAKNSVAALPPTYSDKLIVLPALYNDGYKEWETTFISSDRGETWTETQPEVNFYGADGKEIAEQNGVYNLPGDARVAIALDGFGECTVNLSAVVKQKSLVVASNHDSGSSSVQLEAFLSAADSGTDTFTLEVTLRSGSLTLAYRTFTVRPAG